MPNNFNDTKEKLKQAVIDANTLRKLQNWLNELLILGNTSIEIDTVLFYIDEAKKYIIKQRKEQENGK